MFRAAAGAMRRHPDLIVATVALGILGLIVPLAVQLVFNRILPNPAGTTLAVLLPAVAALCLVEAGLRIARSVIVIRAGEAEAVRLVERLLDAIVRADGPGANQPPSAAMELLTAVNRLKEIGSGQRVVAVSELLFLPLVLGVVVWISPVGAAILAVVLAAMTAVTLRNAAGLRRAMSAGSDQVELRYAFLFSVLGALHPLKALGAEDMVARRFEAAQAQVSAAVAESSARIGRLAAAPMLFGQVAIIAELIWGAVAVANGTTSLGGVSAVVLLVGRIVGPVQKAVFILVQNRDAEDARARLQRLEDMVPPRPAGTAPHPGTGDAAADDTRVVDAPMARVRLEMDGLSVEDRAGGGTLLRPTSLRIEPGALIAVTGPDPLAISVLLRCLAGTRRPDAGQVRINGRPLDDMPPALRNRAVGYVSADGLLLAGTIGDNITRFGEVPIDSARSVARLLDLDHRIEALAAGFGTVVTGSAGETIPPGLRQQIAILRALACRPRLILLDNADRGLDREGYAALVRFLGRVRGQATVLLHSEDANLVAHADRRFVLQDGQLELVATAEAPPETYRMLKL
jgi:ABC-type bacteriocin/lantibiotic exporter with double-glycine peptidase domain